MNRECSLFIDDGCYVIVGLVLYVLEELYLYFFDIYSNNELVFLNFRLFLEDYIIYIVDMKIGMLLDFRVFKCDKIFLLYN